MAKKHDEKYCSDCGKTVKIKAVICPNCGVQQTNQKLFEKTGPKSKAASVVLAVFLSFWTWIYTYRKDSWKFWLGLAIAVVFSVFYLLGPIAVWIWAIIDTSIKSQEWYEDF